MESVSGVFVPVDVLAAEQSVPVETVIKRIQEGELVGRRQSSGWHVLVRGPEHDQASLGAGGDPAPARSLSGSGRVVADLDGPIVIEGQPSVIVRDVHIGFLSLIWLIIKFAAAAVIATLVLGGIGFAGVLVLENVGSGLIETLAQLIQPYL